MQQEINLKGIEVTAQVALKNAELDLTATKATAELKMEAAKGTAQIAGHLAAGAMAGISASASIQDSASNRVGYSYGIQKSERWAHSRDETEAE